MESRVLLVARPGRLPRIETHGGLAVRQTGTDTVHLVSTAATPLGGDRITVRVVVESGARLRVRSVAAAVALPGAGVPESESHLDLQVDGWADVDLQPTVVAGGAVHRSSVTAVLTADAGLRLRERVQVGRAGERAGFWTGLTRVDRDGLPLLRHRIELGTGSVADDMLASPRACASELCCPTDIPMEQTPPDAVLMQLAGGGVLSTWQGQTL